MPTRCMILLAVMLAVGSATAQQPAPAGTSLAEAAAKRFPQPVRVGDLIGRTVLRPLESQPVIGHVRQVVQSADGALAVVVNYGGFLGLSARPIAISVDAMTLAGADMEIVGFTPEQLAAFPTFTGAASAALAPGDTIHVGLSRPSH